MDLSALFRMVLAMSFMGTVMAGIILLVKKLMRNTLSVTWHYYIWLLLLVRLAIPFAPESSFSIFNVIGQSPKIIHMIQGVEENSRIDHKLPILNGETQHVGLNDRTSGNTSQSQSMTASEPSGYRRIAPRIAFKTLGLFWLSGAVLMICYAIGANTVFRRDIRKRERCEDERILRILEDCKRRLSIYKNPDVIYHPNVKTPMLFGIIKPKILIASEVAGQLSEEELEHVFMHELAHLKRGDILINWMMMVLQAVHWFNPIVWYTFRRMRQDCEIVCDAHVLSRLKPTERNRYGQTIIQLLNLLSRPYWAPGTVGIANHKDEIQRRIVMIKNFKKASFRWTIVALVVTALVGYAGLTNSKGMTGNASAAEKNSTVDIVPAVDTAKEEAPAVEPSKDEATVTDPSNDETAVVEPSKDNSKDEEPKEEGSQQPQVTVKVDMEAVKASQKSVDQGHSPWQLSSVAVTQTFVSLKISPEGIVGEFPIKDGDLKVEKENKKEAVVEIKGDKTPIRRVYLERLVKQNDDGIWTVVGYDPVK